MKKLHIETPLIESVPLSQCISGKVWLKMEALQPSGSFKLRGVGYACQRYAAQGASEFISSSGGNAGVAVAYSGRMLSIPVTVVVPVSTMKKSVEAIEQEQATVIVKGKTWQEAHQYALEYSNSSSVYIHPFDDPLLWQGHSSLIDEIVKSDIQPDIIVLSVGGGGLLCGVLEGLSENGLSQVPVVAVETKGADSLSFSLESGCHTEIAGIASIATSLGAKKVARAAYEWCGRHEVISHVVSDRDAVNACLRFSDDHRVLVEPACGASLAVVYDSAEVVLDKTNVLLIICGGAGVTISQLQEWNYQLDNQSIEDTTQSLRDRRLQKE